MITESNSTASLFFFCNPRARAESHPQDCTPKLCSVTFVPFLLLLKVPFRVLNAPVLIMPDARRKKLSKAWLSTSDVSTNASNRDDPSVKDTQAQVKLGAR